MTKQHLQDQLLSAFHTLEGNRITPEQAGEHPVAGLELFQPPLMGIASAHDPLFRQYKEKSIIGPWFLEPQEWLPGAQSVISFFFPFTQAVRQGKSPSPVEGISMEWLFGRIEGQQFLSRVLNHLCRWLAGQGAAVCIPAEDPRFATVKAGTGTLSHPEITPETYGSNWSERHAAYACGLGTFSLTRALITEQGCAGRLGSILTDLVLEPDVRPYSGVYDYCTRCGACIQRCPVHAISLEGGKRQEPCHQRFNLLQQQCAPRYGCGRCQTKVPCQSGIPKGAPARRQAALASS